jgi:hypothetical protein
VRGEGPSGNWKADLGQAVEEGVICKPQGLSCHPARNGAIAEQGQDGGLLCCFHGRLPLILLQVLRQFDCHIQMHGPLLPNVVVGAIYYGTQAR